MQLGHVLPSIAAADAPGLCILYSATTATWPAVLRGGRPKAAAQHPAVGLGVRRSAAEAKSSDKAAGHRQVADSVVELR